MWPLGIDCKEPILVFRHLRGGPWALDKRIPRTLKRNTALMLLRDVYSGAACSNILLLNQLMQILAIKVVDKSKFPNRGVNVDFNNHTM